MSTVSTTVASSSLRSQQQHSAAIYGTILVNLQLNVSLYFQSSKKNGKPQFCIFSVLDSQEVVVCGLASWTRRLSGSKFGSSWHLMKRRVVELSLDSRCASVLHLLPERRETQTLRGIRYPSRLHAGMVCLNLSPIFFLNLHWNTSCILHHRTTHQFQGPAPVPALPQIGNGDQMKQSFQHNAPS